MKCFQCGTEMERGGIVTQNTAMWFPLPEFEKKGLKRLAYVNGKSIGKFNVALNQTRIPNAYFCPQCNQVIGVFDIRRNWPSD